MKKLEGTLLASMRILKILHLNFEDQLKSSIMALEQKQILEFMPHVSQKKSSIIKLHG